MQHYTHFEMIQNTLDTLTGLILEGDISVDWELESFSYKYTMIDYANLSLIMSSILGNAYNQRLADIAASAGMSTEAYGDSEDFRKRIEIMEAPFVYHLGLKPHQIFDKAYHL